MKYVEVNVDEGKYGSVAAVAKQVEAADPISNELMMRTNVGLDGVLLALASGAAAALSLTTGLSSVLVGVMVAVALLKRIHPRVWWRKEKALRGMRNAVLAWIDFSAVVVSRLSP